MQTAIYLESLYQRWRTLTPEGVAFVGVNSAVWHSRLLASALKRHVTFPLYQDTAEWSLFEQLGISQGHILVYDRCGRLTYHITPSESTDRQGFIEAAVFSTLHHKPCGPCCNLTDPSAQRRDRTPPASPARSVSARVTETPGLLTRFFNWFLHRLGGSQEESPETSANDTAETSSNSNAETSSSGNVLPVESVQDLTDDCPEINAAQRRERQMNKIRTRFHRE